MTACSEDDDDPRHDEPRATASTTPTPTSAEKAEYDPGLWAPLPDLGRCRPQPPRLAGQPFEELAVRGGGRVLPAVAIGHGRTAVVLLHQTDGGGFCGWLSFAARIAAVPGQLALAFDLCGYGAADCPGGNTDAVRQVDQVRMAIDEAVRRYHPRRIVLIGASMGGSVTVLAAAVDRRIDAAVDLSGPDDWRGAVVHERATRVKAPLLVAMADDDGEAEVAAAQTTAEAAGPDSRFVRAESGHGYDLLEDVNGRPTPFSEEVLAWIAGS